MSSASLPSNLAQPVQQTMPTSNLFSSNTVHAMDNPNHVRQQELVPWLYQLSYDCRNGGISMSLWPQDDGTDPLIRYQGEKDVMENTATIDMTHGIQNVAAMDMIHGIQNAATMDMPQGMQNAAIGETAKDGDGPAGQTGAVQPHGLGSEVFNWENTSFETAGTSGGGAIVTDEMLDWLTTDEFENLTNWSEL
ncbi:uncharacterized protein [Aegilops tauschii subsp. strangulata]|uniref:uncharacterized protein n=1 Tax=Aegilops tauschii subsp. strangulata TaxID=200361 RepID=UPI001E1CABE4|nr:uncharacterized protein LOC120967292 [Aegilops tauschii subsp. strangulata]